jgi:hypothetical protein
LINLNERLVRALLANKGTGKQSRPQNKTARENPAPFAIVEG